MATMACVSPEPTRSRLVDRIVGPDDSESMNAEANSRVSLAGLLDPRTWNLPGWNDSHSSQRPSSDTIGQLDSSLALLSRYRNTLQPFHRLSSDVLVLIFLELQRDEWNPVPQSFGAYKYLPVTKVCHSWRQVALNAPILWRQLSTRYPDMAMAAIERSLDAGLCFVIPQNYQEGDKVAALIKAVAAQTRRLQRLYIPSTMLKSSDGNIDPALTPLIEAPAPILEILETFKVHGEGDCRPLPVLFKGEAPCLSRLRVQYLCPQLNSISVSKLKYLSFSGKKRAPLSMTVSQLLDLLERCPLLEIFKTEKVSWQAAQDDDKRKVRLEHLKYLELGRANGSVISDIVGRITAPDYAMKLKVWLERYDDNKFYIGIPSEHLLEFDHPLRDLRKLFVDYINGYEGVAIRGATSKFPIEIHALLEDTTVANVGDMDSIAASVFQSICRTFDTEHLEEFAIYEMRTHARWTNFTKKVWVELFKRTPRLKSLYVTTDISYDEGLSRAVLAALVAPDERTTRILCPTLENLFVNGDKTWSSLQAYVMAEERARAGHPLKRVSMRLSHYASFHDPDDTDLPLLRKHVETVDLNPPEISFPDYPDTN
ncbi:uncharacterized protein PHACADRAFT_255586 [Phanerochaete carnosa HHB-10118-sp]|uniref:Uncharacterized protein n=1 Tax=Phanerochaete carnosa (strain HHB-10118-sp) TaxID=650164 RepID=K5UYE6_PHACS|nr:uncharacterized protein PHACADRAFT_255586 [Phanerochaete carnosa HHB-10118-sp]EKM55161.1 hypothetical protein PHACADRAFT_255586 [Phanerochaete carnosa HHB-10118-sp]